ncbi:MULTISPECIES: succinylglutamate desuccinylase [Rheinheimera]|uniref:Succinylglutamate desuccinylase n=1 Tax=Rheinheimera marina TaxID=1774958 RepID=A0ABV9JJX1_9GAMM
MSLIPAEQAFSQLQSTADFLALTLEQPDQLPAFEFHLANGTRIAVWHTGVLLAEPAVPGQQDIVLSSGIHGNETAPIEICNGILSDVLAQKLQLTERVLFLFGNPWAINAGVREIEDNLNRLFSGHHSKDDGLTSEGGLSKERARAKLLEESVLKFYQQAPAGERVRKLYDLHTAIRGSRFEKFAVYPFLHGKDWSQTELQFLKACDIDTFLLMQSPASTFSYFAAQSCQAHGFTLELGKVRPFGQNDLSRFSATDKALRALVSGQPLSLSAFVEAEFNFYEVRRAINKQTDAFRLCFEDAIENFTTFPVGTVLAQDEGVQYKVEVEGEAVIFPNPKVAIGQRAMLLVKPVSVAGKVS